MNWAWATSLDQLWRSPTFPMWLTLAAAGFFGIIVLITLVRAEKWVAKGALRFRRICPRRAILCGVSDHAADRVRRCRRRQPEHHARIAIAAPRRRARPL